MTKLVTEFIEKYNINEEDDVFFELGDIGDPRSPFEAWFFELTDSSMFKDLRLPEIFLRIRGEDLISMNSKGLQDFVKFMKQVQKAAVKNVDSVKPKSPVKLGSFRGDGSTKGTIKAILTLDPDPNVDIDAKFIGSSPIIVLRPLNSAVVLPISLDFIGKAVVQSQKASAKATKEIKNLIKKSEKKASDFKLI